MALLQPGNIVSRSDVPLRVQNVARCLREFTPDEVTVWLEWTEGGEERALERELGQLSFGGIDNTTDAFLVVLDPGAGIVVLEVPAKSAFGSKRRRKTTIHPGRLRRATQQRVAVLRDDLEARRVGSLPVKVAAVLPEGLHRQAARRLGNVAILHERDLTAENLQAALRRILGPQQQTPRPASDPQNLAARAAVKPQIVIRGTQGELFGDTQATADDDETLRALDRKQERLALHLGGGYRLIRGVAGSGKTLVLVCRAKHIASSFPRWRILMLCYNRPLAQWLAQQVSEHPNVEALTLDAKVWRLLRNAGAEQSPNPDFGARRREALQAVGHLDNTQRYDAVLVDEAQDLDAVSLDLAWGLLKPHRTHFVMALDSAQRIYRRSMTWNPPDQTARGRTMILDVNYRNTREVLDLGQQLLVGVGDSRDHQEARPDDLDVMVPPARAIRTGPVPLTLACGDLRKEAEALADRVRELRERDNAKPDQIVVLLGTEELRDSVVSLVPDSLDTKPRENRNRVAQECGQVRIATLGLLKGLEFKHVVICGANHIWVPDTPKSDTKLYQEAQRRLLYVAITRATHTLTITYSGTGIMSELEKLPHWPPN